MWSTDTYWFDIAVVTAIFAVGSVLFGHFEEHKPKWKRLLKVVAVVGLVVGLSALGAHKNSLLLHDRRADAMSFVNRRTLARIPNE